MSQFRGQESNLRLPRSKRGESTITFDPGMRLPGVEPGPPTWQAGALPLRHGRKKPNGLSVLETLGPFGEWGFEFVSTRTGARAHTTHTTRLLQQVLE